MQLKLGLDASKMRLAVLGSGSGGNVLVIESSGRRLMIDAGFSCREIERRLAGVGLDVCDFDGLILTHEHSDHTRGVKRFARRHQLPVYATVGTLEEAGLQNHGLDVRSLEAGRPQEVGGFIIEPFRVPHDAREPIGLVVEDDQGRRVGLVADLGSRERLAWDRLTDLDALVLESNHDLEMLRSGPYPWPLKQRVASRHGHLSNREAADGVQELDTGGLQWLVLYHLSQTNNRPAIALDAAGEALCRAGSPAQICVARQAEPTAWMEVTTR